MKLYALGVCRKFVVQRTRDFRFYVLCFKLNARRLGDDLVNQTDMTIRREESTFEIYRDYLVDAVDGGNHSTPGRLCTFAVAHAYTHVRMYVRRLGREGTHMVCRLFRGQNNTSGFCCRAQLLQRRNKCSWRYVTRGESAFSIHVGRRKSPRA